MEKTQYSYLARKYPVDIQVLDSVFRDELKIKGIFAQTAVIYTYMEEAMQKSCADSAFYTSSSYTKEVVLGVIDEIRLQGFAQLTPGVIVRYNPWLWLFFSAIGIHIVLSCFWIKFRLRKEESEPMETETIMEVIRETETIRLCSNLSVLQYYNKEYILTPLMYTFLNHLWNAPDYYLTYEKLIETLYGSTVNDGKGRLTQLVKRLRDEILYQTPDLTIHNVKGRGYQLNINIKKTE